MESLSLWKPIIVVILTVVHRGSGVLRDVVPTFGSN